MKKLIALLLCALILLSGVSALAQDYTLERKLQLQLLNGSGLKATAVMTLSPDFNMTALDPATSATLKALLPGSVLDLNYIRTTSVTKGQEELSLALKKEDGDPLASLRYATDGVLESLESSLLGPQSLVSLRSDGRMKALFTEGERESWPTLDRVLMAMQFSDNAWRARGETAMKPYLDRLNLWLQSYTKISTEKDKSGGTVTINSISIPAAQLKTELKGLLSQAYQDDELLQVLREQFSASEALAYLQPGMLPGFHQAIDQLPLSGNIQILQQFNARGEQILDEWLLPMAGARGLKTVSYKYARDDQSLEGSTEVICTYLPSAGKGDHGAVRTLTLRGGRPADAQMGDDTYSYTGTLVTQPEQDLNFTVDKNTPAPAETLAFNLYLNAAQEKYDDQTKTSTRDIEITLLLKPDSKRNINDQSVKLTARLTSALGDSKATRFAGQLIWQDVGNQSSLTADITGGSTAPWVIPSVNTQSALRLDSLSDAQLVNQRAQLRLNLFAAIAALTKTLTPTQAP